MTPDFPNCGTGIEDWPDRHDTEFSMVDCSPGQTAITIAFGRNHSLLAMDILAIADAFDKIGVSIVEARGAFASLGQLFVASNDRKLTYPSLRDELLLPFGLNESELKYWATDFYYPEIPKKKITFTNPQYKAPTRIQLKQPVCRGKYGYRRGQKRKF